MNKNFAYYLVNSIEHIPTSEANNSSVKKFPTFYGGKIFLTAFARDPVLNQINTFHALRYILIIHLHLDIPSDPTSSGSSPQSPVCTFPLPIVL